jgi:trehalose 6-phosphate synthase
MLEHWQSLARHTPLAILTDLDGTLIPLAPTPEEAVPDPALFELLRSLTRLPGVQVIVVSGRPQTDLERYFSDPAIWLVAEHGAWFRGDGAWQSTIDLDPKPVQDLAGALEAIARAIPGARVERKSWSCALHYRKVPKIARAALSVEVTSAIDRFLATHPSFERIDGNQVIEVRAAAARKSHAAALAKRHLNGARIVAVGDDLTDEHLFGALEPLDEPILVLGGIPRRSKARWEVDSVDAVRELLAFIRDTRTGSPTGPLPVRPHHVAAPLSRRGDSLLVISNRLPDMRANDLGDETRPKNVGGLVSALEPLLNARRGLWLGWGGGVVPDSSEPDHGISEGSPSLAWFDYKQSWLGDYYNGFCNATLWPLLHSFPSRVVINEKTWQSYVDVHEAFADAAVRHSSPDDTIWVHDYHLLLLARTLRARGHRGRIGLFLHVPFPPLDILELLPWAAELVDAMLEFDLVGFHTPGYVRNFLTCASTFTDSRVGPALVDNRGKFSRVEAFPIGIFPESFQELPDPSLVQEIEDLQRSLGTAQLVLGVDRLDYTKGIALIQISVPSRADVPEYAEQRANVETIVGRVNGQFGEAHWVPIRYLYRAYSRVHLSQLYRTARVGYVTPLRDGMNLVAKEYVASQDPEDPGVLLLSRFAGAAAELKDAVLTNPYWADGMARDLNRCLQMPLDERRMRHTRNLAIVERTTAQSWAQSFLDALSECPLRTHQ